jgi:hypothetical protein
MTQGNLYYFPWIRKYWKGWQTLTWWSIWRSEKKHCLQNASVGELAVSVEEILMLPPLTSRVRMGTLELVWLPCFLLSIVVQAHHSFGWYWTSSQRKASYIQWIGTFLVLLLLLLLLLLVKGTWTYGILIMGALIILSEVDKIFV